MKTDALNIDADGMPLFRPDPAAAPSRIDIKAEGRRRLGARTDSRLGV